MLVIQHFAGTVRTANNAGGLIMSSRQRLLRERYQFATLLSHPELFQVNQAGKSKSVEFVEEHRTTMMEGNMEHSGEAGSGLGPSPWPTCAKPEVTEALL